MIIDADCLNFLDRGGWGSSDISPLASDASARRYYRLTNGRQSAILMHSSHSAEQNLPGFVTVTELLRARGLSAPEIYYREQDSDYLIIEDLGNGLYANILAKMPEMELELYQMAVDLLSELTACESDVDLPHYDIQKLLEEAQLLTEWWCPAATGQANTTYLQEEYNGLMQQALEPVACRRDALVLRDYHAENLFWLPKRRHIERVGLIDYQDALIGASEYDLVSLIEDARRDLADDIDKQMRERWLTRVVKGEREAVSLRCSILAAQRNAKIIGIFSRLCLRDGKPRYMSLLPRTWRHLMNDLSHPQLDALRRFFAQHVPEPSAEILQHIQKQTGFGLRDLWSDEQ